jgi:ferric-dicitrate binding protein FerR (iron transport regulator)
MRQIYTSPRQDNIDAVVALMAEHGIEATVANRSNYNRPTWQRFSYAQRQDRSSWPQVWISSADDYARARALLREIGIEPLIRHSEELAAARNPSPVNQRDRTVARARRIVLLAVLAAAAMVVLRYMHVI